jgi:hypothetical protein
VAPSKDIRDSSEAHAESRPGFVATRPERLLWTVRSVGLDRIQRLLEQRASRAAKFRRGGTDTDA